MLISNATKKFNILAYVLYNYFFNWTKLFSDLAKIFRYSSKIFFQLPI